MSKYLRTAGTRVRSDRLGERMYFWRIGELKSRMATAPLTERETLPYVIATYVLVALVPLFAPETRNTWDYAAVAWSVFLAVLGTLYVYRRNRGDDGSHFLQRYFAIGWVTMIRWLAVVAPLLLLLVIWADLPEQTTWYEALCLGVAELVLYERIGHHIGDVANAQSATRL